MKLAKKTPLRVIYDKAVDVPEKDVYESTLQTIILCFVFLAHPSIVRNQFPFVRYIEWVLMPGKHINVDNYQRVSLCACSIPCLGSSFL